MLSIVDTAITYAATLVLLFSFVYFPAAFILTFIKSVQAPPSAAATVDDPLVPIAEVASDTMSLGDCVEPNAVQASALKNASMIQKEHVIDNSVVADPWQDEQQQVEQDSIAEISTEPQAIENKSAIDSDLDVDHNQVDAQKAAELLTAINQIEPQPMDKSAAKSDRKKRSIELAGQDVRIYRYHQHDVVLVKDLPFMVPAQTKRYRLRKRPAIALEIAQDLAQLHTASPPSTKS